MGPAIRLSFASRRAVWLSKACARIVTAVASLGFMAFVSQHIASRAFSPQKYNSFDYMEALIAEILAVLSTIFNLAEVTCIFSLKGHRGVTPGALAVGDFVLFVLLVLTNLVHNSCNSEWCRTSVGYDRDPVVPAVPFDIRGVAFWFGTILCALHFVLFIAATAEAIVRRKNTVRVVIDSGDEEAVALAYQIHQALLGDPPAPGGKVSQEGDGLLRTHSLPQEVGIKEKRSSSVLS